MTELIRNQFETWTEMHYLLKELPVDFEDGEYTEPEMQYAWESWEASRAAVVIELPSVCQSDDPFDLKRDIIYEIEAAGLKTK